MSTRKVVSKGDGSKTVLKGGRIVGNLPSDKALNPPSMSAASIDGALAQPTQTDTSAVLSDVHSLYKKAQGNSTEAVPTADSQDAKPDRDETFGTAWARHQREREEQGLQRHNVTPRVASDAYTLEQKRDSRTGDSYYVVRSKVSGRVETFPTRYKAECWARLEAGEALEADDMYAYKSMILTAVDNDAYSNSGQRQDTPIVVYTDAVKPGGEAHTFRIYRYADSASPSGESWHADFDYPDALVKDRTNDGGRLWEGDKAPTRDDLIAAVENYHDRA